MFKTEQVRRCEKCNVEDTGFNLELHLTCESVLCSYCVATIIREWKHKQNNKGVCHV